MEKVFFVEKKETILDDEVMKRKGFDFESAETLGRKEKGYYFVVKAEEEFFKEAEVLKKAKEITGKKKDEILQKFKGLEEDVFSGVGNIF
jgi:phage terminase large subunit-like protein